MKMCPNLPMKIYREEDHVETDGEVHLKAKKRELRRNETCQYFDLICLPSKIVRK